ncbi:MAG: ArsA family ATPase, partial [Actinomycetota bacterium]
MSDFLSNPDLKLIIFGGKGGCGKTTSAAATALHLSKIKPQSKILVVSTDPAHSLGDSLNIEIGNKITPVAKNVWGYEIDAQELLVKYKAENAKVIKKIAERGTFFDSEDIENFFVVSLPGLDEVMAIIEISNILGSGEYDIIVLDTAPTGHTIALLSLPEKMERWVEVVDLMIEKHRYIAKKLVGRYINDDCDEFLESQRKDVSRVKMLLTDSEKTEFVPVTIPEVMSINEIEKLIVVLKEYKISVRSIIVNRINTADNECPFCLSKKTIQKKYLEKIEKKFASYNLVKIPLFSRQIWGIKDLKQYEEFLFSAPIKENFLAELKIDNPAAYNPPSENMSEESDFSENSMNNILKKNLK